MVFGFNTDLKIGSRVYHVQTEDRGAANPLIDTTIYSKGHILHRRVTSYRELLDSPGFSEDLLRQRLEEQHRGILEELRSGALWFEAPGATPSGIQVQLLNPASWFASGTATLEIEVRSCVSKQPLADAQVQVSLEGWSGPVCFARATDAQGRATLSFPMPRLGPGGTELVIRAASANAEDEIRYSLRPKARPASP